MKYFSKRLFFMARVGVGMLAMVGLLLGVTGCRSQISPKQEQLCRVMTLQYQLAQQLSHEGIEVIQVGDDNTLVLPADNFFYSRSNHLRSASASQLAKVIAFMNTWPLVNVQVTGYTDNMGNYVRNLALSRAQAQEIADYLWQHGLNTRLISARGMGCHDCIADNSTSYGRHQNRRIEIYFRLPPPDNVFH